MKNSHLYFKNEDCEFFPCHKNAGTVFNCMFCCCPLFPLGDKCGGNFVYIEDGIKDCSNCLIPHSENGYAYISARIREVSEMAKRNRSTEKDSKQE